MGKNGLVHLHLFAFILLFRFVFVLLFFALFVCCFAYFQARSPKKKRIIKAKQKQKKTKKQKSKINAKKNANGQIHFFPLFDVPFFPCFLLPVFFSVLKLCFLIFYLFSFFAFFSSLKIIRVSYRAEHKFSIQHLGEEEIMLFLTGRNNSIARNWPKQHEGVAAAPNFEPNAFRFARPN